MSPRKSFNLYWNKNSSIPHRFNGWPYQLLFEIRWTSLVRQKRYQGILIDRSSLKMFLRLIIRAVERHTLLLFRSWHIWSDWSKKKMWVANQWSLWYGSAFFRYLMDNWPVWSWHLHVNWPCKSNRTFKLLVVTQNSKYDQFESRSI